MKRMLMMANDTYVVFFPSDKMREAIKFRKDNREFRRRRIRDIVQVYPEMVKLGILMKRTDR